jgi:hypothetical protein
MCNRTQITRFGVALGSHPGNQVAESADIARRIRVPRLPSVT